MSEERILTREEKLAPIIAKAWQDEAYKQELLADPKAVIMKEFGVELPAGISLEVLEENPTKLYIVLPAKPTGELTDEQLEAVAGGFCIPAPALAVGLAVGLGIGVTAIAGAIGIGVGKAIQQRGW